MTARGFAITPITLWRRRWLAADAIRERRQRAQRDRARLGERHPPARHGSFQPIQSRDTCVMGQRNIREV